MGQANIGSPTTRARAGLVRRMMSRGGMVASSMACAKISAAIVAVIGATTVWPQ